MFTPGRWPVIRTGPPREYYLGMVVSCASCAFVSEVNMDTGLLMELPRVRLADLFIEDNGFDMPRSTLTLGYSLLFNGRES